jgi:hypothetical protein
MKTKSISENNDQFGKKFPVLMVFVIAICVSFIIYLPFLNNLF